MEQTIFTACSVNNLEQLSQLLQERGAGRGIGAFTDYWVGTLAGVDYVDMKCKCENHLSVDEYLVRDIFTHAYILETDDIKSTGNALLDQFGLGLRKKRIVSKAEKGCVFLLLNNTGQSAYLTKRQGAGLESRNSGEFRRRALDGIVHFVTMEDRDEFLLLPKMNLAFWSGCVMTTSMAEAENYIANITVDQKKIEYLFSHVYLHHSQNCQKDCDEIVRRYGNGLRQRVVTAAKERPGIVFLLIATKSPQVQAAEATLHDQQRIKKVADSNQLPAMNVYRGQRPAEPIQEEEDPKRQKLSNFDEAAIEEELKLLFLKCLNGGCDLAAIKRITSSALKKGISEVQNAKE